MTRRRNVPLLGLVPLLLVFFPVPATVAAAPPPARAIVAGAVENLYGRPDETSPVEDQIILGEAVEVLEETAGFAKVRTEGGTAAWIPERALRRGVPEPDRSARVTSLFAHLYSSPDFTAARPLLSAPFGARLAAGEELAANGHAWVRVTLPDGRRAIVAREDVAILPPGERPEPRTPAHWIATMKRFLGAPYTWGGTSPAGFDCSGLVWRVLREHGVVLLRNSYLQCFRDSQLAPVAFESLRPGDLLFFGTEERIDHEAVWLGDGKVLQATAYGVPSTQITEFATSPRLKPRFRYARRLALLSDAPKPAGLAPAKRTALELKLKEIAREAGATFGVVFKDLTGGGTVRLNERKVFHAASTMKTPVLLEALRQVDAGTLKLEDEIPVVNEFRSLVDGSPFKLELDPATEGPTAARLGGNAPLGFLLSEMIVRSSNLATDLVLTRLSPESVQKFANELGASSVKVRRCVEDGKAYERGINNETDAEGMATVMEACLRTPRLSAAAKAKVWEILAGQTLNEVIPAGLHPQSGAVVAHKTGSISSAEHDAGIVRLPDGREYVLVLLSTDFGGGEEGKKCAIAAMRKMSRAAWDAMIAP